MAVLGEPVDEGVGQVVVFEEGTPFGKAQIGGDEGGLFFVALMHQGKEQADLDRFDLHVAKLIDEERVKGQVFLKDFVFGVVGDGGVEFVDEVGEEDVTAADSPGQWRE